MKASRRVAVLGGNRIPFARANGAYVQASNADMLGAAMAGLVDRFGLAGQRLGEVVAGALLRHQHEWKLARECVLGSALDSTTPAYDLQQGCGTGLQAAIAVANKIALGQIEAGIAGGVDTTQDTPSDDPEPRSGLSMGEHAALTARTWGIPRADQDELTLASHLRLAAAYERGFFDDLMTPYLKLTRDQTLRSDLSSEKRVSQVRRLLAGLRPVFGGSDGSLTAGNSSALTDGAALALLASPEWAAERDLPVLAWFVDAETAAVDFVDGDEGLLMAPAYAVPRLLDRAGLGLQDFDFYEFHEAFAAQVLSTLAAWESPEFCKTRLGRDAPLGAIDRSKLNVTGSSLAIGHPFAATGGRILATLAKLLAERGGGRGLISVCTAGGQGVAAILER